MGLPQFQAKMWRSTVELCERFGRWVASENSSVRLPILILIGLAVVIGGSLGIMNYSTKSGLSELYIDESSRMFDEFDRVKEAFGGLSRTESVIMTAQDDESSVTRVALSAWLDILKPISMKDESHYCDQYDGVVTTTPAKCSNAQYSKSLYCNCEEVASNPDMITIDVEGTDTNGDARTVTLSASDLCESPPVQFVLKPSTFASLRVNETGADSTPLFQSVYASALELPAASPPTTSALSSTVLNTAKTECIAAFKDHMNSGDWDAAGAGEACVLHLVTGNSGTILGPVFARSLFFPTGSLTGFIGAYNAVAAIPYKTTTEQFAAAASAYVANGGIAGDASKAALITLFVIGNAVAIGTATTEAFVSQESYFISEQNTFAFAVREVANCVADYQQANRAAIKNEAWAAATSSLFTAAANDARDVLNTGVNDGENPTSDSEFQARIAAAFFDAMIMASSEDPYASALTAAIGGGSALDPAGEYAARIVLYQAYLVSGSYTDTSTVNLAKDQYKDAAPGTLDAVAESAVSTITLAFTGALNAMPAITQAIIAGGYTFPRQLIPNYVTLDGDLEPLPKTWGIDRYPCTRGTPLDTFREGDFDYPYALKQLEQVAPALYFWHKNPVFAARKNAANCINTAFVDPLKRGIYFGVLTNTDYIPDNIPALTAGENAFLTAVALGNTSTAAAGFAVQAFIANNGTSIINGERQRLNSNLTFLTTSDGIALQGNIGTAIATAAGNAQAQSEGLLSTSGKSDVLTILFGAGYWWRPTYGDHWTAASGLTDAQILDTIGDAIVSTDDANIDTANCVLHNTDVVTFTGRYIKSCYATWSGLKLAHEIAYGDTVFNNDQLLELRATRYAGSLWNEDHPTFQKRIDALLYQDGTTSTQEKRIDVQESFENAVIDYMKPLWAKSTGTDFNADAKYGNLLPTFLMEKSTADAVDSISDINPGIIAGAVLAIIFYACMTMSNRKDIVHSHMLLTLWGVIVICASTAASFGFSFWFGLDLTSLNAVVVPFISLGIGVDDMFVLAQSYALRGEEIHYGKGILAAVLGEAGPSVTFTSLTNAMAFFIATATPVYIVRIFCLQMGISVVLNWICLILLFLPAMVYDARRTADGKPELIARPCGSESVKHKREDQRALIVFARDYYGPFLANPAVKAVTLILFGAFFGLMLWQGVWHHEEGLRRSDAAPSDGYVYAYVVQLEEKFTLYSGAIYHFSDHIPDAQANMLKAKDELQQSPWLVDSIQIEDTFWLSRFLSSTTGDSSQPLNVGTEAQFYAALGSWLQSVGTPFAPDIYCIDKNTLEPQDCFGLIGAFDSPPRAGSNANIIVAASKAGFYLKDQRTHDDLVNAIIETREVIDPVTAEHKASDPTYDGFVWGYTYLFWEQYLNIEENLYFIVGMALVGVFGATFLFQFSWETSLILCIVILMVDFEIYGFMGFIGVKLNGFSLGNLCVAVGMAVEFTAHIAHEFLATSGESRDERMIGALTVMFRPMFHGMMTSTIATCFIAATDVEFVQQYYFGMMLAMIVIAFLNGMWLLPVLLSMVGPRAMDDSSVLKTSRHPSTSKFSMDAISQEPRGAPIHGHAPPAGGAQDVSAFGYGGTNWWDTTDAVPGSVSYDLDGDDQPRQLTRKVSYLEVGGAAAPISAW